MQSAQAQIVLKDLLWECEKKEIAELDVVYFFNIADRQKNKDNPNLPGGLNYGRTNEQTNNGFDSDQ